MVWYWLTPWLPLLFLLMTMALSRRAGRLRLRPQDASLARAVVRGTGSLFVVFYGFAVSMGALSALVRGVAFSDGGLLVSALAAYGVLWWWTGRSLPDHGRPDPRMRTAAAWVFGVPIAVVWGALVLIPLIPAMALAAEWAVPSLGFARQALGDAYLPLVWALLGIAALAGLHTYVAMHFFLLPLFVRTPDGVVRQNDLPMFRRRWSTPPEALPATAGAATQGACLALSDWPAFEAEALQAPREGIPVGEPPLHPARRSP